tara:strand:+ start:274 stop:498 length:225 start_codon:yes stop_codon:yes gene_type:complete
MPLITLEQQKIMTKLYEDTFNKFMQEHATLVELVSQISINRYTQEEYRQIVQSICTNLAEKEATDIVHGNMGVT